MSSKRDVSSEQSDRHKRILTLLLKVEGNKCCADCRTRNPTWASVNLGVFVCLTCSGIHRSLGVHISQVRSTNLDTWLPRQVEFVRRMGNVRGNAYWEAQLPAGFRRPPGGQPNQDLANFIRAKYVERRYALADVVPVTIDNYTEHPLMEAAMREDPPGGVDPPPMAWGAGAVAAVPLPVVQRGMPASSPPPPPLPVHEAADLLGMDVHPAAADPFAAFGASPDPVTGFDSSGWGDFESAGANGIATPASSTASPTHAAAAVGGPLEAQQEPEPLQVQQQQQVQQPSVDPFATLEELQQPQQQQPQQQQQQQKEQQQQAPQQQKELLRPRVPPKDPFAHLVSDDLVINMKATTLGASGGGAAPEPQAQAQAPAQASAPRPTKSAEDILRLYDAPGATAAADLTFASHQPGFATASLQQGYTQANGVYAGAAGDANGSFGSVGYPQQPAVAGAPAVAARSADPFQF